MLKCMVMSSTEVCLLAGSLTEEFRTKVSSIFWGIMQFKNKIDQKDLTFMGNFQVP